MPHRSPQADNVSADSNGLALPGIRLQNGFRFRAGQAAFLSKLAEAFARGERNHLGVFVPGYGKTITALASFVVAHAMGLAERLVIFVPRGNLRDQYADPSALSQTLQSLGAPPFTFCVADSDQVFLKNLDTALIVSTYQYASGRSGHKALLRYCRSAPCMFAFDEVHHLSDDGTWASKIGDFPHACSVALSGTPMRSDNKTLFGVPFETDAEGTQYYVALHEVTLRDAHEEGGILKRVEAHAVDYHLRMVQADTGEEVELSLSGMREFKDSKEVDTFLARRRLRFHEVYLENLLGPAFERFAEKRRGLVREMAASGRAARGPFRNHQMLVIAMSNRHAAAVLDFVRARFPQYTSARIGQDLPQKTCEAELDAYREGRTDVMVQVDMIGEGTDIKPISTIVKADLVRAFSKTMQQVFRGMRYYGDWGEGANVCDLYAAGDTDVVSVLEWITSEEQLGVAAKSERQPRTSAPPPPRMSERSAWELKQVKHQKTKSHALELFPGAEVGSGQLYLRELHAAPPPQTSAPQHAVDVNAREKELRKACAELASELAFALEADGRPVAIREVHAQAKRRLAKGQSQLSLGELEQKRRWLERCLRARRLL